VRRAGGNMSKANSKTSSGIEAQPAPGTPTPSGPRPGIGRPDCPQCGGLGYLRRDLPVEHPDFGRVIPCTCVEAKQRGRQTERLQRLSRLDQLRHFSFDNFQPRGRIGLGPLQQASLEQAFNQARTFASQTNGWLVIQGGYGCGKTHLAAAIANQTVAAGVPTLYLTVPDLLDWLRASYDDAASNFEERFDEIREVRLLVLDDFGSQSATPWAQEKVFQILNHRYVGRLPTVITTNEDLDELDGRIRSRLADPELVTRVQIQAPDYRQPTHDSSQSDLSTLAHHTRQTFGTFSLREEDGLTADEVRNLKGALETAHHFAEDPRGWLVLLGGFASGKTHLAASIANYRNSAGYQVLFVEVPDLLDHLRATFSPSSNARYDRRFDEIRSAHLLVLDDLGTQNMTPWVREKLYQLFNYRYNAELPTVITTSDTLEEIDARIRTRMLDSRLCSVYAITAPASLGGKRPPRTHPAAEKRRTSKSR
jgi:DNA replication protein DnaC